MRRLAAALAVLLSAPAFAQREITGLDHHEPTAAQDSLRGPVRSVRNREIGTGTGDVSLVTTYDRAGRRAETLTYRGDDLRSRLVYTYDARSRNTGWESYEVPRGGGPHMPPYDSPPGTPLPAEPERRVYVLDDAGRRMETREIGPDGTLRSRVTYAYDSAGRVREMAYFDHAGRPGWRRELAYDSAGRPLEDWGVTRYDSLGRRREVEVYDEGAVRWRTEYRYDGEGRLSEEETRDLKPGGLTLAGYPEPQKVVYTYHPDGGRTMETIRCGRDGAPTGRVVDRFDASGRRVEREELNADGTRTPRRVYDEARGQNLVLMGRTRWTEELDAQGNWISRGYILIPDDGGPPHQLWEIVREITYW